MDTETRRGTTRRKVFAITAGCAALGIGVTATLAAWTDSEWVFGGNGAGGPGIGTSAFSLQQSTDAAGGFPAASFVDEPDNPGGEIVFAPDALALTPGDAVYAAVALRTGADSDGGDVELQTAVAAAGIAADDPAGLLFAALQVAVVTDDAPFACAAGAFSGAPGAPALVADGPLSSTGGSVTQALAADSGSVQYYCFEIALPDPVPVAPGTSIGDYMGLSIAPAWEFAAISS